MLLTARGWRQHGINHQSVLEDSFQVVQGLLTHIENRWNSQPLRSQEEMMKGGRTLEVNSDTVPSVGTPFSVSWVKSSSNSA